MKLRRVILNNWCQFDHLEQELGNGLIGIVGRNGKGKSNILKAIIFACTGWTAQTKDCYVKHGKSNAEVTVEFQTDATGKLYKVVRAVTSTNVVLYENINDYFSQNGDENIWLATTKGSRPYTDADFTGDVSLLFGKETAGLPAWLREKYPDRCIRIPMISEARSLNLSNSVAVIAYEALRQQNFPGLKY